MVSSVPLTTLLSWTWIAHTMEVDNGFEAVSATRLRRHFRISLVMWTNALRFIDESGITVGELSRRARAGCNLGGLERWGWISVAGAGDRRRNGFGSSRGLKADTVLVPTSAGTYARRAWPKVIEEVEERWRARFGKSAVDELREALESAASPMPWSPPIVSPANGFLTHVVAGADAADPERPLVALLGQVLTAATLDHERWSAVSAPLGADLLRVIGTDTVPVGELPGRSGLSKEAVAMAVGFLQRRGLALPAPSRSLALSPDGLDALEGYRRCAARARDDRLRAALDRIVSQAEALSAGLAPPAGCWRGEKPYLSQTRRLLADPTAALPWHPMVLHRGGWPDGS